MIEEMRQTLNMALSAINKVCDSGVRFKVETINGQPKITSVDFSEHDKQVIEEYLKNKEGM